MGDELIDRSIPGDETFWGIVGIIFFAWLGWTILRSFIDQFR